MAGWSFRETQAVEDPPKSYAVGRLQSPCSSAATAVQLVGVTLGDEGEAYVNFDAGQDQVLATRLFDRGYELRISHALMIPGRSITGTSGNMFTTCGINGPFGP